MTPFWGHEVGQVYYDQGSRSDNDFPRGIGTAIAMTVTEKGIGRSYGEESGLVGSVTEPKSLEQAQRN